MIFFLRSLLFSWAVLSVALSSVVLAFILNANMVPVIYLMVSCGVYAFVLAFLIAYPLLKLSDIIGRITFIQKNVYGGSFARLRK